jgi:hypothetical protein
MVLWISFLIYLPPFVKSPNVKGLVEEGNQMYTLTHPGVSKQDLEQKLNYSLLIGYAKSFAYILIGILSGVLLYKRKRIGKYIAIILCSLFFLGKLYAILSSYPNILERLKSLYVIFISHRPLLVIHVDIVAPLFFIFTIVFLLNKSVSKELTNFHTTI